MQKSLLSAAFQGAIPYFPASTDFEVINFVQSCRHPRDAIVLCKRTVLGNEEYVVWTANMIEGGCHGGTYVDDPDGAWREFQRRLMTLN